MYCVGHGPADDLRLEDEPLAARQGLELDVAHGVLAVPAGLLDVAAGDPRGLGDRLAHRRPGPARCRPRRRPPAAGRARRRRAPRPCTTARSGGSPGCGRAAGSGPPATIFASVLHQRVLVAPGVGGDRDRAAAARAGSSTSSSSGIVGGRHRVAGLGAAELGERADVARAARLHRVERGAHRRVDVREALVVVVAAVVGGRRALGRDERVVPADVHGGVGAQRAGEHPHERHPAHVGVGGGAHDLRGQRAVRGRPRARRARSRRCPRRGAAGARAATGTRRPAPRAARRGRSRWTRRPG